jgi:hypothetical protein
MSKIRLYSFRIKSGLRIVHIRAKDKNNACDIFLNKFPNEAIIYCRLSDVTYD